MDETLTYSCPWPLANIACKYLYSCFLRLMELELVKYIVIGSLFAKLFMSSWTL
jgi:hypothetical protein